MAEDRKEFQRRLKAFKDAFDAEDWDKAIEGARWVRENKPSDYKFSDKNKGYLSETFGASGTVFLGINAFKQALSDFDYAITLSPGKARLFINRGITHTKLKDFERALADYNKAIELEPNSQDGYTNRGTLYLEIGNRDAAIRDFDTIVKGWPKEAKSYFERGIAYNSVGEHDNAFEDFNTAIEIDSGFAKAYCELGVIHRERGNFEEALSTYNQAIILDKSDATFYYNRGIALGHLNRNDEAIKDFEKAIELNPSLKGAVHNRAITIGKIEAEKATKTIKESYEERLSSITKPADIDKRFEARKKISEERLNRYRNYTAGCIGVLVFLVPIIWYLLSYEIELFDVDCKENGCSNFFLIAKNISITVTTLFLLSPIFIFLSYCNRNARIERHTLEDYDRKSIMLLIRNQEGAHIQTLMEHLDKRGTPEVLNKLYHPKQAHAQDSQQDSREGLLKSLSPKNPAD
ncbi:MAG: tetratricopeptide repeat protein [Alphaproteobacteria bacterium]|nr:tetratricopeptide repeat protein [Alphaproteobacteria bacterium]MBL6775873.1 tetratricopeptide repeat protein [Alphaproteobacteria bacterium]